MIGNGNCEVHPGSPQTDASSSASFCPAPGSSVAGPGRGARRVSGSSGCGNPERLLASTPFWGLKKAPPQTQPGTESQVVSERRGGGSATPGVGGRGAGRGGPEARFALLPARPGRRFWPVAQGGFLLLSGDQRDWRPPAPGTFDLCPALMGALGAAGCLSGRGQLAGLD